MQISRLAKELDALVIGMRGGGFGDPDALAQHQREIDLLKFKIARRDNMRVAVISTLIGAAVAGLITLLASAATYFSSSPM